MIWMVALLGADWPRFPVSGPMVGVPTELNLADVDADGDLDVLYTGYWADTVGWYENAPRWPQRVISGASAGPRGVDAVDIDQDGILDVLTSSDDDRTVAWHRGRGDGAFGPRLVIDDAVNEAHQVAAADIDGDGWEDAVYAGELVGVRWARNEGGRFSAYQPITTVLSRWVEAADLDGDGHLDVLFGGPVTGTFWVAGGGDGSFGAPVQLNADPLYEVIARDVDADGDLDVLYIADDDLLAWHENLGDPTQRFGPPIPISTDMDTGRCVRTDDIDGDGDLDIVMASHWDGQVTWFAQGPVGVFTANPISTRSWRASALSIGDLDGDGDPDVVVGAKVPDSLEWFANDGLGGFGPPQPISRSARSVVGVDAADFDGDGRLDPVSISARDLRVQHYVNRGGKRFRDHILTVRDTVPTGICADDLDQDGDPDLLVAGGGRIDRYENLGGQLRPPTPLWSLSGAALVATGDLDGDNDRDVVIAEVRALWWLERRGNRYIPHDPLWTGDGVKALDVLDLDGDGDEDLVLATPTGVFLVHQTPGGLRLSEGPETPAGPAVPVDLDDDGVVEIVGVGAEVAPKVPAAAAAGDVDCDGDADVVVQMDAVILLLENVDGTLACPVRIGETVDPIGIGRSLLVVDLEGRRGAEVLVADYDQLYALASPRCEPSAPVAETPLPEDHRGDTDAGSCGCDTGSPGMGWLLALWLMRRRP